MGEWTFEADSELDIAIMRERNGRFTGVYKVEGKQRSAGTFGTFDEAIGAARREEAKRQPKPVPVMAATVRGKITVGAHLVNVFLKEHGIRDTTRENYKNQSGHIISRIGSIPLAELTPQDVRRFARQLVRQQHFGF